MSAAEKSRTASQAASAAKTVARNATQMTASEIQAALDEVSAVQDEAQKAKVPDRAFEELLPRVEGAQKALDTLKATLARGEFLEAQKEGADLKGQVVDLPDLFRKALVAWQEEHKRGARPHRKP